jgi:glycosyltransferase involved in cell wall biosynthesis
MSTLFVCVVIPCLNEEQTLAATCEALGFGAGCIAPGHTALVLVDNGSTDRTRYVAEAIQGSAPRNSVIIGEEKERGYVPPRRYGNALAIELARSRGFSNDHTLIVQADADTIYDIGYLGAIRASALTNGAGLVYDARMEWPPEFTDKQQDFLKLCDSVDEEFAFLLNDNPNDVLVDDKACAYYAADYLLWGEHTREFTIGGDEILSETTRLYLRGKSYGARRCLCDDAVARHSARRVIAEPSLSFATAGFPRENAFRSAWRAIYDGPESLSDFVSRPSSPSLQFAIRARRAHLQGLFSILPAHVNRSLRGSFDEANCELETLPSRSLNELRTRPGQIIEDVLNRIDQQVFGI